MNLFAVCLGGAVGSGLRYLVALGAIRLWGPGFPMGTLMVNLAGCFLMGLVASIGLSSPALSPTLRLGLTTGLLGGFTTFSAFSQDAANLFRQGSAATAAAYVVVTLLGGLTLVALGMALGKGLIR